MVGDASEHVSESDLGIDVVELGGDDQGREGHCQIKTVERCRQSCEVIGSTKIGPEM